MHIQLGTAFILALAVSLSLKAEDLPKDRAAGAIKAFDLSDTAGARHTAGQWQGKKAVLLLFIAPQCPVSNFYSAEYSRLAKSYGDRGVATYGIHCEADLTAADAAKHANEYGLKFPILLDPTKKLARAVGATTTPQAVLLSPQGDVLYRGRIDDRFALNGKRRDVPTRHDLADALDAVLAGKMPPEAETKCFGCPIPKGP